MAKVTKIGVLTSGGDAPGMNAAIRAVVRSAIYYKCEAYGIYGGYQGLINGDIQQMTTGHVSNIMQRGGTILKTARSTEFKTPEGRQKAYENLKKHGIDALVVIGGDGSFTGARIFSQEFDIPTVGIPGTIDNDMFGTDHTIGYDTAVNTAMEAIDKIKDTASAHNRLFFIEVMGRDAGFIALRTAIATGAEAVLVPEFDVETKDLVKKIARDYDPTKSSGIVIVAEGAKCGGAYGIAQKVKELHPEYEVRCSVLGYQQRGGRPTQADRVLASQLGVAAVDALLDDQKSIMIGIANREIVQIPFNKVVLKRKGLDEYRLKMIDILAL